MSYSGFEPEKPFEQPFSMPADKPVAFTTPQYPTLSKDIESGKLRMEMTQQSIENWQRGRPGQGYIGLAELPKENDPDPNLIKIHLIPSFNKNDGMAKTDKHGEVFSSKTDSKGNKISSHLISSQPRGTFTGDLHMMAARSMGLGNKGQENGLMMGFGVWKAGNAVRIVTEDAPPSGGIRQEYTLTLMNNGEWKAEFTNAYGDTQLFDPSLVPGLKESLEYLSQYKFNDITEKVRQESKIDEVFAKRDLRLQIRQHGIYSEYEETEMTYKGKDGYEVQKSAIEQFQNNIKWAKNRSTSQNTNSIKYSPEYQLLFNTIVRFHQAHALNLKREIPLPIFEKIMHAVADDLKNPRENNLVTSEITPKGDDALGLHLSVHQVWDKFPDFDHVFGSLIAVIAGSCNSQGETYKGENSQLLINTWRNFGALRNIDEKQQVDYFLNVDPAILVMTKIAEGDVEKVKEIIITYKIDPNSVLNYEKIVIEGNAQAYLAKPTPMTPLGFAIQLGNYQMAEMLLRAGADITATSYKNENLLFLAVENNDLSMVKELVDKGINLNQLNKNGETALFAASRSGSKDCIKFLIEKGVDYNDYNNDYESIYSIANNECRKVIDESVAAIVAERQPKEASKEIREETLDHASDLKVETNVNDEPTVELTAKPDLTSSMELAIKGGNFEAMLALINQGANPNMEVEPQGTPLKVAVQNGNKVAVNALIAVGADPNFYMRERETVLFVAARNNDIEMIKLLLEHNVETNIYNSIEQTSSQVCQSDEAKELIFSHDMAAQLPPTYPENARKILSKIYLSVEPIVSAVARTSEEKFDPQIVGGMLANLMTYDPETHGDMADYFNPILTELNNFLTEFKQYASTNTRLYDDEDIIKVDKALAKIAAVAKNLTSAAMNEVKSDVDNDQSHSLANSTTLLMKKLDVDPVTAREESKMEVKEKPAEEKPAATLADTESHTKEAANDEIMTSSPRSMRP